MVLVVLFPGGYSILCAYSFHPQPPPSQYDHSVDEKEHTVEQWKGEHYLPILLTYTTIYAYGFFTN